MTSSELSQQLDRVRAIASNQLVQFARSHTGACQESYLFRNDHFCGIKFAMGNFQAVWEIGQASIAIRRHENVLQTVALTTDSSQHQQRRAA